MLNRFILLCNYKTIIVIILNLIQLRGMMRVVMKPLITISPLVGGLQVFFLNQPEIDYNLVGVADVLEIPGLK